MNVILYMEFVIKLNMNFVLVFGFIYVMEKNIFKFFVYFLFDILFLGIKCLGIVLIML